MSSRSKEFWDSKWKRNGYEMTNTSACFLFREDDIKGKKILDVGCGNVKHSVLESLAGSFTGVDISINALRDPKAWDDKRKLFVCDAEELPFRANRFDSTFSTDTIPLLGSGYYKALEEMKRVTKDVIVFDVTHVDDPKTSLAHEPEMKGAELVHGESCMILKMPDMPDRVYFDESMIRSVLEKLDLIPESIITLTANEVGRLGVSYYKQRYRPELDYNRMISIRALKRN